MNFNALSYNIPLSCTRTTTSITHPWMLGMWWVTFLCKLCDQIGVQLCQLIVCSSTRHTCGWWTPRRISAVPLRREQQGWWLTTPPNWRHSWNRIRSIVSTTNSASPKAICPSPPHMATVTSPNKLSCGYDMLNNHLLHPCKYKDILQ